MLRKTNLMAVSACATMLICSEACAEPSAPKNPKQDQKIGMADTPQNLTDVQEAPVGAQPSEKKSGDDSVDMTKLSEAFGHFIGRNLKSPGVQFNLESIIIGMRNGAAGKPAPMSDQDYELMMVKVQETAFKQLADDNLKAANDFLSKNSKEKGVIVIEPGKLQYLILEEGKGDAVTDKSVPQIEYVGKYIDGTVFGSSDQSGGPITIPLDQTIPGFSKGILNMKEGEKRRLFVHPDLGYGMTGQLPPNSLLIFDIKLIKAATKNDAKQSNARDKELLPLAMDDMSEDDDEEMMDEDLPKSPSSPKTTPIIGK